MTTLTQTVQSVARRSKQSFWRLIFDHKNANTLNLDRPTKILFDQKENLIGDMIVNTVAFGAIKRDHPDWVIHVLAGPVNRDVVVTNPHIDKIHLFTGVWSTIRRLRQEQFDIFYFNKSRLTLRDYVLLRYTGSKVNVGRSKPGFRLFDYSIDVPSETEFDRFARFLELLGINDIDRRYEFPLTTDELSWGRAYVSQLPWRPVIAFNRFGDRRGKLFSRSRAIELIREIDRVYDKPAIVLLCSPATKPETIAMQRELGLENVFAAVSIRTIREAAAIVHHADLVVTPDTSIVHIACAFDKPQICVYRDRTELKLWRPLSDKAIVLLPRRPSRHVDEVDLVEFSRALEAARPWFAPEGVE